MKSLKNLLIYTLVSLYLLPSNAAYKLSFIGVNSSNLELLNKDLNRSFSINEIDNIIKTLAKSKKYGAVKAHKIDQNTIRITAVRKINFKDIKIQGLSDSDLKSLYDIAQLNSLDIKKNDINSYIKAIDLFFQNKGEINYVVETNYDKSTQTINILVNQSKNKSIFSFKFISDNKKLNQNLLKLTKSLKKLNPSKKNLYTIEQKIVNYFKKNRYLFAKISPPKISLTKESQSVIEYYISTPYQTDFTIEGNLYFSKTQLIDSLLAPEYFSRINSLEVFEKQIESLYAENGFPPSDINISEKFIDETHLHKVFINMEEKERLKYRRIRTISTNPKYNGKLNSILDHTENVLKSKYFTNENLEFLKENYLTNLKNNGFLSPKILEINTKNKTGSSYIDISIYLNEGPRTIIDSATFFGTNNISEDELKDIIEIKNNSYLDFELIEDSFRKLSSFYKSKGYLEAQVTTKKNNLITFSSDLSKASLNYYVEEGEKVTVGDIQINGASRTKKKIIFPEIDFKKGETLTPNKISESISNLQKIGYFSSVSVDYGQKDSSGNRIVQVNVSERNPGLFSIGLGINNEQDFTFRGYTGLTYRNIGGTGRGISTRLDLKYSSDPLVNFLENQILVSYLEPYFFAPRVRGRLNVLRAEDIFDIDRVNDKVSFQEKLEGAFLVEKNINSKTKLTWNMYTISDYKIFEKGNKANGTNIRIGSIGPLLEFDYRDNYIHPKAGNFARFDLEYGSPFLGSSEKTGKDIHYYKLTSNFTHYSPFKHKKYTWVNSLRIGHLSNLSNKNNSGIPSIKAFFLGGRNTLRGFDSTDRERVPTISELNVQNLEDFFVTKHSSFYLFKSEFRMPLSENFGASLFYDGGAVYVDDISFKDPYRDAIGAGLRFLTPVGAVSIEYGFKLDKKQSEDQSAFHLSISTF